MSRSAHLPEEVFQYRNAYIYEPTLLAGNLARRGVAVFSRENRLVGRAFSLKIPADRRVKWGDESSANVQVAIDGLRKICIICKKGKEIAEERSLSEFVHIIIKISLRLLLVKRFCELLAATYETVASLGHKLSIVVDTY
jgi:hypothetical protein